jgi:ribonucleoside-diphosphate reductase alpha chain
MTFSYGAVKQLEGKYLVQNRVSRQIFESPQFLYMLGGDVFVRQIPKTRAWLM